jgi:hypothetical protein
MSSPADDEDAAAAPVDPTAPTPDPALSYPRGNRLGIRHPRPTVVIVVAVLLVVGGAWAWQALRPTGYACGVVGTGGTPVAATPDAALQAWLDGGGDAQAQLMLADEIGRDVDRPGFEDFEHTRDDPDLWIWWVGERGIGVEVGAASRVSGVNVCATASG